MSTIKADIIINAPLRDIKLPASDEDGKLSPPRTAVAGHSTSSWARTWLSKVTLSNSQWVWNAGPQWFEFQAALGTTGLVDACIPDLMFDYPRSEADVMTLVDSELLSVVHRVGKKWLPEPPRGLEWKVEVIGEAYAKSAASPGGVRVDKIFIASAKEKKDVMWTRSMGKVNTPEPGLPKYAYVPRGQLWEDAGSQDKTAPPQFINIGRPKALVAIEMKDYGMLDNAQTILEALGAEKKPIGAASSKVPNASGIRAVMQQALRYSTYYGTQYLYVTDFKTAILLNVPAFSKGQAASVRWAVVGAKDARKGLAFLVCSACTALKPKSQ